MSLDLLRSLILLCAFSCCAADQWSCRCCAPAWPLYIYPVRVSDSPHSPYCFSFSFTGLGDSKPMVDIYIYIYITVANPSILLCLLSFVAGVYTIQNIALRVWFEPTLLLSKASVLTISLSSLPGAVDLCTTPLRLCMWYFPMGGEYIKHSIILVPFLFPNTQTL